jgi:hypothetical protein
VDLAARTAAKLFTALRNCRCRNCHKQCIGCEECAECKEKMTEIIRKAFEPKTEAVAA